MTSYLPLHRKFGALVLSAGLLAQLCGAGLGDVGLMELYNSWGRYSLHSPILKSTDDIKQALGRGNVWSAAQLLGDKVIGDDPISLPDIGALQALLNMALVQLTLSAQDRVLLASGKSINENGQQHWEKDLAIEMQRIAQGLPGDKHVIATGYIALYWLMTSNYRADADGLVRQESYSSLTQAWWLSRQAGPAAVQRICEVGFNAGHSALSMLLAAPASATMVSFDISSKSYTPPCAAFISDVFPGRFTFIAGPSNETVPQYALEHFSAPRCDVVYIDGGHEAAEARADLLSMSLLSDHGRTLVVMDDIGCEPEYCIGPTIAWQEFQKAGRLRELGCQTEEDRRWCWGLYM